MKPIFFFIRCREHFTSDPEEMITLYGEETQFEFMSELCRLLTHLNPDRLVEFGHYSYDSKNGTVGEAFFSGEEINLSENGAYWKLDGNSIYTLKDTPDGFCWEYSCEDSCTNI